MGFYEKQSSDKAAKVGKSSFPILGIMFLIFLTLKLIPGTAVAAWSWWAVTAPLWGPFLLVIAILVIVLIVALIAKAFD